MNRFLPSLSLAGAQWARLVGLAAAAALLIWAIADLRPVLAPILAALVIAYILNPVVTWFENRGCARLLTIAAIYFFGVFALFTLGAFVVSHSIEQTVNLRERIDVYFDLAHWLPASPAAPRTSDAAPVASGAAWGWWNELGPTLKQDGLRIANGVVGFLGGLVTNILNWLTLFVFLPMYSFFFLWRFNDMLRVLREHLPSAMRADLVYIVSTADSAVASFFRGRLIVCGLIGLSTGLGWTLLKVPFGLPLGALAGVLSLVPFMSVVALPPALLATYAEAVHSGANWAVPVSLAAGVFALVQALDSFVFSPLFASKASGLHPLTTVIALLIGGRWAGMLGLLLAIPAASTLKVLAKTYVLPHIRRMAAPVAVCEREPPEIPAITPIAVPTKPTELKTGAGA